MNSLNLIGICFFFNLKKHTYIIQVHIKKKNLQISSTGPADIETRKYFKKRKEHAILLGGPSRYREGK
jgi:hypothetical protein